jgi:N-acyl-L-homoserine lactone synthetase
MDFLLFQAAKHEIIVGCYRIIQIERPNLFEHFYAHIEARMWGMPTPMHPGLMEGLALPEPLNLSRVIRINVKDIAIKYIAGAVTEGTFYLCDHIIAGIEVI